MLDYTIADAVNCLKKANNLNAAVKHFLKREVRSGDPSEKFAKELREIIERDNSEATKRFFDKHIPRFERQLFAIGGYAHWDFIGALIERIGTKHADQFNATYAVNGESIEISDQAKFDSIAKLAISDVDHELANKGFPDSKFLKNVILSTLFEPAVLRAVSKLL